MAVGRLVGLSSTGTIASHRAGMAGGCAGVAGAGVGLVGVVGSTSTAGRGSMFRILAMLLGDVLTLISGLPAWSGRPA